MEMSAFGVRATAGTLRDHDGVTLPHVWTPDGVVASPVANGAQVLHLAVALCVLNDTYREADRLGIPVAGIVVEADGAFTAEWASTGISYAVEVDSPAAADDVARLGEVVDRVAEIPRAVRAGATVARHR